MKLDQECIVCFTEKNLHFHECRATICDSCLKVNKICQNCNKVWDANYRPVQLKNYISSLYCCLNHVEHIIPNKLPSYFCKDCFNYPKVLEDFINSIPILTDLPEYLKRVYKLISKADKELKIEFVKILLGHLGVCCVKCQGTLKNKEKSRKTCKKCWEFIENLGPSCKSELETKYYSWIILSEDEPSDLYLKLQALRYFSKKFNYNPAFNCYECGISFETPGSIPINCESTKNLNPQKKVVCVDCVQNLHPSYKLSRYEYNRLCINNCGYAGECLLKCNHSVCLDCGTGKYFICCGVVNNIEELENNKETYFYLCEDHQISSNLFSEKTGEFYCKYCTDEVQGTYKVSENIAKLNEFLIDNYKRCSNAQMDSFYKELSSVRYKLCKPVFDARTNVYLFEKIIPQHVENLSQSWVVTSSDIYVLKFRAKEFIEICGVYITGSIKSTNFYANLEIKIDKKREFDIKFKIYQKKIQLIKINTLPVEQYSECEMIITFKKICKKFCYSGINQKISPYIEVAPEENNGLFFGFKKFI